jgi:prephenate dehydratase
MSKETAITIAFQGAYGAYSHQAGNAFLEGLGDGKKAEYLPLLTFDDVIKAVESGKSEYGIIPLENSSIGTIVRAYNLLADSDTFIVGEISIPIHHQLMGLPGADTAGLKEIHSHPAALDQCGRLFKDLPGAAAVVHFDTAGAAKYIRDLGDKAIAAIASEQAAAEWGLEILKRDIEDYAENSTRFGAIVQRDEKAMAWNDLPLLPYKLVFSAELPHCPGSLARLLQRLASLDINLTKIESRPIPEAAWHYRFILEMELDDYDQDRNAKQVLADSAETCRLLGRFTSAVKAG